MILQIARAEKLKEQRRANSKKKLIKEDEQSPYPGAMRDTAPVVQKNVSLDQAIDRYLVRYEREAIPSSAMYESAFAKGSLIDLFEAIMKEQDDPMAGMDMGDDAGGGMDDAGGDSGGGGGTDGPPMTKTPRIDLNNFAMGVARLVNNYQSLIDPKSIILNRAEQYIANNYDERTGKELVDMLKNNYGLSAVTQDGSEYGQGDPQNQSPTDYTLGATGGGDLSAPSSGGAVGGEG